MTSAAIDNYAAWYEKERTAIAKDGRSVLRWIKVIIAITLILTVPLVIFAAGSDDGLLMGFLFVSQLFLIVAIGGLAFARHARLQNALDGGKLVSLPKDAALNAIVRRAAEEFEIDPSLVRVMVACHTSCLPSIEQTKSGPILVAPLGLLTVAREDPDIARAMVMHEMAHILHGDSKLWRLTESLGFYGFRIVGPIMMVNALLVLAEVALTDLTFSEAQAPYLGFMFVWNCERLLGLRRKSELVADAAVVMRGHGDGLLRAVESFVKPGRREEVDATFDSAVFGMHPARNFRMNMIRAGIEAMKNGVWTEPLLSQSRLASEGQ